MSPLRNLPSIHELLESPPLKALIDRVSRSRVTSTVTTMLDELRREVQSAANEIGLPSVADLAERIARRVTESVGGAARPTINATGFLLNDEFGPAPLAECAISAMAAAARDFRCAAAADGAQRSAPRTAAVAAVLCELTGAEAALVVNSKASAMLLLAAGLAADREIVVARSQLGESDDGCRLADLLVAGGAALCEVGAANSARADDYRQAIGPATAALLVAHPSNFAVAGSMGSVTVREACALAAQHKTPVVHDLGFGGLLDAQPYGFGDEPAVDASIQAGASVVVFGGDRLLGGPRCGILVGTRTCLEKLAHHPMAGALQPDQLTLAALTATLELYRDPEEAQRMIPLLRLLTTSVENLRNRAERLAPQAAATEVIAEAEAVAGESLLVSEALPDRKLPTWCVSVRPAAMDAGALAARLRAGAPAVAGRVCGDRLLFDLRSVLPRQDLDLLAALEALGIKTEALGDDPAETAE